MIYICNMRDAKPPKGVENHVRVDRASPLGNPFQMKGEKTRDAVCEQYAAHLPELLRRDVAALRTMQRLVELARKGDLYLYCWCAPKRCHAESIKAWIEDRLAW
jgi:hypothetical protein